MADLTVSSFVDTFMASATQQAMMDSLEARIEFMGSWSSATTYTNQQMVTAGSTGSILAVANKSTTENPVPQATSRQFFSVPNAPTWVTNNATDYIQSGIRVSGFNGLYELSAIRVWIGDNSADASYRIVIENNTDNTLTILDSFKGNYLTSAGWVTIPYFMTLLEGSTYTFYVIATKNTATSDSTSDWDYKGFSASSTDPGAGNLNHNGDHSILRIDQFDDDNVDQATPLSSITPGAIIRVEDDTDATKYFEYEVIRNTNKSGWFEYDVVLLETASAGPPPVARAKVTIKNPVYLSTYYPSVANQFVSSSVLDGYVKIGAGATAYNDNAYGIDLQIQTFSESDDWEIMPGSTGFGVSDQADPKDDKGWAVYADSVYTNASKLSISNAKVQLTIDGLGSQTNKKHLPKSMSDLWSSDKIVADTVGDVYDVMLEFKADPNSSNDSGNLTIDVGSGSPINIVDRLINLSNVGANHISIAFPIYVLHDFVKNGAKIYFDTSVTGNSIELYDISIFIVRR